VIGWGEKTNERVNSEVEILIVCGLGKKYPFLKISTLGMWNVGNNALKIQSA
jgi:hypothetical protein